MTVFVVQRPQLRTDPKTGKTYDLDLSSAGHYGKIEFVFETTDRPSQMPGPMLEKARGIMGSFGPDDFLLWAGGDPCAFMICTGVAANANRGVIQWLRWDRQPFNRAEGRPIRPSGSYLPTTVRLW